MSNIYCKKNTAIRVLYSLFNRKSRLNTDCKLYIYKVAVRPIMTYGAPIFNNMVKSHKKRLQVVHNKLLKMILKVPFDTSTNHIHEMTQLETVNEFLTET